MAEALKNIANALKDSRVRTIVIFTCAILLVGVIITIIELRSDVVGPEIKASVGKAPAGMESIPGGFEQPETIQYATLQEKENALRAKRAEKSGSSAIPTITRSQKLDGTEGDLNNTGNNQNWQAGLGFSSLGRTDESGMAPKGLGTDGTGTGTGLSGSGTGTGLAGAGGLGNTGAGLGTNGAGSNLSGQNGVSGLGNNTNNNLSQSDAGLAGRSGLGLAGAGGTGLSGTGTGMSGLGTSGTGTNGLGTSGTGTGGTGTGGLGANGLGTSGTGTGGTGTGGMNPQSQSDANLAAIAQRQAAQLSAAQLEQLRQQLQAGMTAQANQLLSTTWGAPTQQYVAGTPPQPGAGGKNGPGGAGGAGAAGLAGATSGGGVLFKAGTILFGILTTSVNSDEPGPVMATIVDGPYKGAKLLGAMTNQGQKVMLSFNLMSMPGASKSISLNAVAIDPNTARTALSSDTNNHILLRYGTLFASSFIQGYGQAFSQSGQTITTNGLQTNTTNPDLSGEGKFYVALGNVGTKWGQATANLFNRPPTVQVYAGSGVGILILADVTDGGP